MNLIIDIMAGQLGAWLAHEINQKGWSMRETARRVGVSHTAIANAVNGKTKPEMETCLRIAEAFEVPVEEIYEMAGVMPERTLKIRDGSSVYQINTNRMERRLTRAFALLDRDEQELVVHLAERLAGLLSPRVVGESADE